MLLQRGAVLSLESWSVTEDAKGYHQQDRRLDRSTAARGCRMASTAVPARARRPDSRWSYGRPEASRPARRLANYDWTMSELMTADRRATIDEVAARRVELRELSSQHRFGSVRVAADGMIIVHTDEPGYRDLARFAGEASRLVGAYVQVITDDVAAGSVPADPL